MDEFKIPEAVSLRVWNVELDALVSWTQILRELPWGWEHLPSHWKFVKNVY